MFLGEDIPRHPSGVAGYGRRTGIASAKGKPVAAADQPLAPPDDTPTHLPEELPDPFTTIASRDMPQAVIVRVIQRDGAAIGVDFDEAFAAELAKRLLDALRDDEEAAIDLASFVFDADVRRALTA